MTDEALSATVFALHDAEDRLDKVRVVHAKRTAFVPDYGGVTYCVEDRQTWPCATIRAIGEASPNPREDPF